jgi:hypothetical protein
MKEPSQKDPDRKRKSNGIPETPLPQVDWDDGELVCQRGERPQQP